MEHYRRAISLLEKWGRLDRLQSPQTSDTIDLLEVALQVKLPPSYRAMLQDFGILIYRGGEIIYGIGLNGVKGEGGSGVWFQTEVARARGQISQTMVCIMSSGYGPEFCIECAERQPNGESPVYLVPAAGYPVGLEKVADSFGEFLLKEVELSLDD
ncbi:MAG: SMI1/KNR4 family protein [Paracoccus sp. (in: a-proteobacteria)]|uniref:SMI1/KNR4 family protein n=1 Tax=Paracoccus sp. TaxID=267 RepID=UPI0026DFEFC6|nr:SMI1/KNR4 family protein [Paracoccus sp. (in: a-proteobacteria)]MDO5612459.1 SMI1/KNR4 family protein [Paracoccus sp. (in: a-proteobacteria)]